MYTTKTDVVIDVNDNQTGNFMTMTDAIDPNLGISDSIYGIVLKDKLKDEWEVIGGYLQPLNSAIHSRVVREFSIVDEGAGKKLILNYNNQTGDYEISVNDFTVTELAKLNFEIHRIDWNRVPRAVNA